MLVELKKLLNKFFFPSHAYCSGCGRVLFDENDYVCPLCLNKVKQISGYICAKCGRKLNKNEEEYCNACLSSNYSFDKGFSLFVFDDIPKKIIIDFKYHGQKELAYKMGKVLYDNVKTLTFYKESDIIIPVPPDKERFEKRGYNQAELIAFGLSERSDKPCLSNVLVKTKETKDQINLSRRERFENMIGAFDVVLSECVVGKRIVLVDDVFTTGATIESCAKVLLDSGATNVSFISLASTFYEE